MNTRITSFVLLVLIAYPFVSSPVYADTFGIEDRVKGAFDWFFNYLKKSNDVSNAVPEQKEKTGSAIESGHNFTTSGVGWWFDGHQFIVDLIFAGSPVPIDSGVVAMIAVFAMIFLIAKFMREHLGHFFWILLGVLIFVLVIILLGIRWQ